MGWTWLIVIVAVLGWLYFSAKLRTLRLRIPPTGEPPGSPAQPGAG
jgi:hypothetical protein